MKKLGQDNIPTRSFYKKKTRFMNYKNNVNPSNKASS